MKSPLFTSSSSAVCELATPPERSEQTSEVEIVAAPPEIAPRPVRRSSRYRWPIGGAYAVAFILIAHTTVSLVLVPDPIADQPLRRKVLALTERHRPRMIIAGDSRAQLHVRPDVLAESFGWPDSAVVNIGMPLCEVSAVLAVYREFSDRFAHNPIMVVSISLFGVNDGARKKHFIHDETVWSLSVFQRFRLLPPGRAFLATFLPERGLVRQLVRGRHIDENTVVPEFGFVGKSGGGAVRFSHDSVRSQMIDVQQGWFGEAQIDGIRWKRFVSDLESLIDEGVQLVLLDSPVHPAFWEAIRETPQFEVYRRYQKKIRDVGQRLRIPVLQYSSTSFGDADPNAMFYDITHLSRLGATRLSDRLARDLRKLVVAGALTAPADAHLAVRAN
ncbi:MAG: hypothetical protein IID42_13335 [Planctomycetes bacterium]|nr:hypothetical protein [Planctomycetota bacterium]